MEIVIRADNLTKIYDGKTIGIKDISFEVEKNDIFALVGPNGAGKTSLIKILATIHPPTQGQAYIKGYDVYNNRIEIKRKIGYVPENITLLNYLKGIEFLHFIGEIRNIPEETRIKRINFLSSLFNFEDELNNLIQTYSKGTRKKIVLASAFIHSPEVILLDEPTANLDPEMVIVLRDYLKNLQTEGITIFICTHTLDFAQKICNKVGILSKGRLSECGNINNLFHKYNMSSLENLYLKAIGKE